MSFNNRMSFTPFPKYSSGVLIGNWIEDSFKYIRKPLTHNSTYLTDFTYPKITCVNYNEIWDQKLAGYGYNPRIIMCDDKKYLNNYVSTNDLIYRHFKRDLKGPILKSNRIDCTEHFGNITKFGLSDVMHKKWECDKNVSLVSEYKNCFVKPKVEDYVKVRRTSPKQVYLKKQIINK